MRAIVVTGYGDVDKLELRDVSEPSFGAGEVKVLVRASSVNPVDWKLRSGVYRESRPLHFPAILGRDASGEVVGVGEGVRSTRVGDRVLGLVNKAYAEFVVDKEEGWAPVPDSLDLLESAALPLVTLTGTQLIEESVRPSTGDVVLVTGALGGVGRSAVFAAQVLGARVLAGVRSSQLGTAATLKAEAVAIDDDAAIARLPQLDSIADTVGGVTLQKLLGRVKPGGVVGSVLGEPPGAKQRGLSTRPHMVHPDRRRLAELARANAEGKLIIPIAKRFPLAEIREAQAVAQRGAGGKVLLLIR
jgi:NADPH:quinone reductase-like Zn-dependent oxidoreductase